MWVHPAGGSDNPGNSTSLVFHNDKNPLSALKFIFFNNQLKQYTSGKFVHPLGGHAGNGTKLVLYDGSDGERTSIYMVEEGGRTYLKHGNYYVHPAGGSDHPSNGTPLVYHSDFRPTLAISLILAENLQVLDFKLHTDQHNLNTTPMVVSQTVDNTSTIPLDSTVNLEYNRTLLNSFSLSCTKKWAMKIATKGNFNLLLESGEISVEFSTEYSGTESKTNTITEAVKASQTHRIAVPPGRRVKLTLTTYRLAGEIPFTTTLRADTGYQFVMKGKMKTEYFFDQSCEVCDLYEKLNIIENPISYTPWSNGADEKLYRLCNHDVKSPENSVLLGFHLVCNGPQMRYEIFSGRIVANSSVTICNIEKNWTPWEDGASKPLHYLGKQTIHLSNDRVLLSFRLEQTRDKVRYCYTSGQIMVGQEIIAFSQNYKKSYTDLQIGAEEHAPCHLDRQNVKVMPGHVLLGFRVLRDNKNMQYEFYSSEI
eukprot:TRINITY_DN26783_c0_g1_i1.p1 TRINITY_DN26783_c0_g1~~TRINITY_DN26783_c0_g1_i1.p1  ORF type:complete len:512 (+),score=78.40 TRINITY_DN26783_c0_g1_i1:98-1537(+)